MGVSASRNIGIEKSKGDFILFLDDDCKFKPNLIQEYIKAYNKNPTYFGYIGLTSAPEPETNFDRAVCLSDMRHFFEIAKHKKEFFWGITANLFLKREAIGTVRFSSDHPKKGGGEDITFCLEVLQNAKCRQNNPIEPHSGFKCVPEAEIEHAFWKENLNGYKRFFRWGYGDVILHKKFPEYRFHQYPNLIEFTFIAMILNIIFFSFTVRLNIFFTFFSISVLLFTILLISMFIWEILCEAFKLHRNNRSFKVIPLVKAVVIRQLNDMGRFFHQFPKFWKITCRWDYFCTGESIKYETKTASMKFYGFLILYVVVTIFIFSILLQ